MTIKIEKADEIAQYVDVRKKRMQELNTQKAKDMFIDSCNREFIAVPENKYLKFNECANTGKTKKYHVINNVGDSLGLILWSTNWRRYIFNPSVKFNMQHDAGCLVNIAYFIQKLMEKRT